MFCVWAFCHTTYINTILYFCPNRPGNTLVNTCNSWRGADVTKAWKQICIFPLRYYENCVSTTLTVLIMLKVSISFIVILYIHVKPHEKICGLTCVDFHENFKTLNKRSRKIVTSVYAWKINKYTNNSLNLLIMYGSSYMFRHYTAILRERS
jgi:hypothetical protein